MIEKALISNFRLLVRAYAKATGDSVVKISKDLYGNARFLERFFAGQQSVSVRKFGEMLDALAAKWPAEEPWPMIPVIIMRPRRGKSAPLSPRNIRAD